jgi:RHS repeat-associated protein
VEDLSGRILETHTYDGTGRAWTSEISGGQEKYTFDYTTSLQTKVTDALGNETFYDYTNIWGMKFVTKITGTCSSCGGGSQVQSWTYDDKGRTKSYTDGNGNVTQYDYDPNTGDLVSMTEAVDTPQERTTIYTNDAASGLRTSRTVPSVVNPAQNKVTAYTYENGQLKTLTETGLLGDASPYSYVTTYGYTSTGKLSSIDGPRTDVADVTTFDHDSVTGDLTSVTVPLAGATTYSDFTPFGQAQTVTDPNGVATTYAYDARMRVASMTIAGDATSYHYGPSGKLKQIDLPRGNSVFYDPDPYDRLEKIRDHLGNYIKYTYDLMSQRTKDEIFDTGNVLQKTLSFEYDGLRRLKNVINPDTTFTQYGYDGAGNRTSVKNPRDFSTTYDYDALNRQSDAIQPGMITTRYGYDTHDGLSSITDPNGYATTHLHDDMGRVYQEVSPDTGTTNYSYDPAGNRTSKTDARGIAVGYTYDALNRLTLVNFPSDPDITYTYDVPCTNGKGRLCQVVDQAGTTTYSYSAKGQLSQETKTVFGAQYVTAYPGYDPNGNLTLLTYPSGRTVTYTYDLADRVSSVSTTPSGGTLQTLASAIQYKPFGGMSALTYGNGIGRTVGYDLQYRISSIQSGSVQNLTYGPDANGNILTWNNLLDPSKNKTLGYDALDRLESATGPWGSLSWTYDGVGNRFTQTAAEGSSTYTYQAGTNRLASIAGPSPLTFGYDNNGNITTYANLSHDYDQNNRLKVTAKDLGQQIKLFAYTHYASGQRARRIVPSGRTVFHYDQGGQPIAETLETGTLVAEYIHLNGQPLAKAVGATVSYVHPDHLGAPALMTDSTGTNVWAIEQRPFGDGATITGTATLNLRFPGQYFDSDTGLHENWWREYNPTIGRYNQADPLGVGYYRARYYDPGVERSLLEDPISARWRRPLELNPYAYVGNNPMVRVDPSGLAWSGVDCAKRLAELAAAIAVLAQRLYENANDPDPGHNKAIRYQIRHLEELMALVAKHCGEAGRKAAAAAEGALAGATTCVATIVIDICVVAPQTCCNGQYVGPGVSCGT